MDIKINVIKKDLEVSINRQSFALALKTWRLENNLKQTELAKKWNVSRYTIIRAEKARPISWETAYKLFAYLSEELKGS